MATTSQRKRKTCEDAATHDPHPSTSHTPQMDDRECYQVFLSHSGHQKSFVEQLFVDLQRENISCFFDKDPGSLPKGEVFPPRIFKAARECKVGVVVLSDEFLASKWPMLELCEFVRAKNSTNGKLKILPLFFLLSPKSLSQKLEDKDSLKRFWQDLFKGQKRTTDWDEWIAALQELGPINGEVHNEQETEVDYRAKIVSSIRSLLPPELPYDESYIQGKERLCQKVARLFNNTPCGEDGVKVAGLYGVAGIGKTTLAKLACNFYSSDFDGRVLHLEFGKEMPIERLRRAFRILTNASEMRVNTITDMEQGWCLFNKMMRQGRKVFVAVDNVTDLKESMDEAQRYLRAFCSARNQSMILLTARSSTILRRFIAEGERSCIHVPSLEEEEAIPVLLELTPLRISNLSREKQDIAKKCALKCYFSWQYGLYKDYHPVALQTFSGYHPLALKAFGASLYDSCTDLFRWIDIQSASEPWRCGQEEIFRIFEESFQHLSEVDKKIFMLLCLYLPECAMIPEEAFNWLAFACDTTVEHIKFAIVELQRKGFVESEMLSANRLYIHDLYIEFAASKADGTGKWISLKERLDIPASLQEDGRPGFLAMKFDNCHFQCPSFVNNKLFKNVLVLHLQDMPLLKIVDLSPMRIVRSITIVGCGGMQEIRGLESLRSLVYFVVKGSPANVQFPGLQGLLALQHLEIDANLRETTSESSLLSWTLFPPLQSANVVGTINVEHIKKGTGRLDLSACSRLRTIKLKNYKNWTEICLFTPNLAGLETQAFCSTSKYRSLSTFSNLSELHLEGLHNLEKLPNLIGLNGLRILKLCDMHSLKESPTFTGLTALQWLTLKGMQSLKGSPTLTGLTSLKWLTLEEMQNLKEPPSLTGLTSLESLTLKGIQSLKEPPSLTGLTALKELKLVRMHSLKEPPTLTGLTALKELKLLGIESLKEPPTLTGLTALEWFWFWGMQSLKEPPIFTGLTAVEALTLEGMQSLKEPPTFTRLTALKFLKLKGMQSLKEPPTFTGLTALQLLKLEGMQSLKEPPTFTGLTALKKLTLEGMQSLKEPPTFTGLTALKVLTLKGMQSLKEPPTFSGLTALQLLKLEGMQSLKEPPTFTGLTALEELTLEGMQSLKDPPTFVGLTALQLLKLEGMQSLKEPPTFTGLTALEELTLEGMQSLKEPPTFIGLTALQLLKLEGMQSLKEPPTFTGLTALEELTLQGMQSLKEPPTFIGLTALQLLKLDGMQSLKEPPTFTGLTALEELTLEGMQSLQEPPTFTGLTALEKLMLKGMQSLKEPPTFTGLTALKWLTLQGMQSLKEPPTFIGLTALELLKLEGMQSLKEPPTLTRLTALKRLTLEGMQSLKEHPTLTGLTALKSLTLKGMQSLKGPPTLTGLTALESLTLKGMQSLKEPPTLTGLTALETLELEGMQSLKEPPILTGLTELGVLKLEGMQRLKELPTITGLTTLCSLYLTGMHRLRKLPSLAGLTDLQLLELEGMLSLKELPELPTLREITLEGMHSLENVSTFTTTLTAHHVHAHKILVEGMHSHEELSTFTKLTAFQKLTTFQELGLEMHISEVLHILKVLGSLTGLTFKIISRFSDRFTTYPGPHHIYSGWTCYQMGYRVAAYREIRIM